MNKLILISCMLAMAVATIAQQSDISRLSGPYLGQKPPGNVPEIFAPGVVSLDNKTERSCLVWEEGKHILVGREGTGLLESYFKEGKWSPLDVVNLFGEGGMQASVSPDNKKIFFNRFERNPDVRGGWDAQIWVIEKNGNVWSKPVNTNISGLGPSVDLKSNLYYSTIYNGLMCIAVSRFENGKYMEKEILPEPIYSKRELIHPCIAPDGSWMTFNTEIEKYFENGCGLFISFKNWDSSWSKPVNMGSFLKVTGPLIRVSNDGKYLLYSWSGDIYWVSAKIIEELKPTELK